MSVGDGGTLARVGRFRKRRGSLGRDWRRLYLLVGSVRIELAARRGFGYTAWAFDSPRRGRVLLWGVETYQEMLAMRKKRVAADVPKAAHLAPMESQLFCSMMSVLEHCAMVLYDDGTPRKPGWYTVRTFGSTWQMEIKDPDTLQMMRITQPTHDDMWLMAALLLASEDAPWEPDVWAQAQARKSKK